MKLYWKFVVFEKESEIEYMKNYNPIKLGNIRIYIPKRRDFIDRLYIHGQQFCSMSVEIFNCLKTLFDLLFCWVPYIAIDNTKK